MIEKKLFGTLSDGREVYAYTLKNANGMSAKILSYGGAIAEIRVPDRNGCFTDVVGGYDCLASYVGADGYQGALIGRFGNRINKGKFTLDGVDYSLFINNNDNHLHGGQFGYNSKIWDVEAIDSDEPVLKLHIISPDGDEGYPGNLDLTVTYKLSNMNGLSIRYEATTDKATPINLTNHCYFNLGGYASGKIYDMELMIDADTYLPTDERLIPTGELKSVEGTPFDFREPKPIGKDLETEDEQLRNGGGYDHNWVLDRQSCCGLELAASVHEPSSGRFMEVLTDQPAIQFYGGNFFDGTTSGKYGRTLNYRESLALETQKYPDTPNHEAFPSTLLEPGEKYTHTCVYRFSVK